MGKVFVLSVMVLTSVVQAGELGIQAGIGQRSGNHGRILSMPAYQLGTSIRHHELIPNLLWPEVFVNGWYSERNYYIVTVDYRPAVYSRYYDGFAGLQAGLQVIIGKRRPEDARSSRLLPQAGIGLVRKETWGVFMDGGSLFNASYGDRRTVSAAKLLGRLTVTLPAGREVFLEGETYFHLAKHHPANRLLTYLFSMGYRFSAF